MWSGLNWLQMNSDGGLLWTRSWAFGFLKREDMLTSRVTRMICSLPWSCKRILLVICQWHSWELFIGNEIWVTPFLCQHSPQIYKTVAHNWQVSSLSSIDFPSDFSLYMAVPVHTLPCRQHSSKTIRCCGSRSGSYFTVIHLACRTLIHSTSHKILSVYNHSPESAVR
jgi:hypothetical protein